MTETVRKILDELLDSDESRLHARVFFLSKITGLIKDISSQNDAEDQLRKFHLVDSNDNLIEFPSSSSFRTPPSCLIPPPPPLPPPPPPPIPPLNMFQAKPVNSSSNIGPPAPPPPPSFLLKNMTNSTAKVEKRTMRECPQCMIPKKEKTTKTRTVQWSKINSNTVSNDSVWGKLANATQVDLNFELLDNFFGIESASTQPNAETLKKKPSRKETQVELLTSKRSQNVAIMLKQFKNVDEFLENVKNNRPVIESDALQNLYRMLPQVEEEEALKRYSGDITLLSQPSSFFFRLVSIPFYKLRVETLIFISDFSRLMQELAPNMSTLISAAREILESPSLPRLLLILVNIGNYLNCNNPQGNAFGFTLNSIWKLIDLKGNKQEFSLLHLLVSHDMNLVGELEAELSTLKDAAQISFEEIKISLKLLKENRMKLEKQLEMQSEDEHFHQFIELVKIDCAFELKEFESKYEELCQLQHHLANYFCENRNTFQLDECFKIFMFLLARLHQANKERVLRELRKARKQVIEEEKEKEKNKKEQLSPTEKKENVDLFDTLTLNSNNNAELIRKRASDNHIDIRQKLGNVRIRKVREILNNKAMKERDEIFISPQSPEVVDSSVSPVEAKECGEPTKTSSNYQICNDLESYISNLSKKRASHVLTQSEKEKEQNFEKLDIIKKAIEKVEPSKIAIPKAKIENDKLAEPETKFEKTSLPMPSSLLTNAKLRLPSSIKAPVQISKQIPVARIVSVIPQKPEGLPKMAEIRKPLRVGQPATSPISQQRKITPPRVLNTTPKAVQSPTTTTTNNSKVATPRVTVVVPSNSKPATSSGISLMANRRMSAPVVRKVQMTAERRREITMKPSVSTSARPSLINTSSTPSTRSALPKMSALEKPKPLRITPKPPSPQPNQPKTGIRQPNANSSGKPKWV